MIDVCSATTAQKQPKRNFNLLHQQMKHTAQFPDAVRAYKLKAKAEQETTENKMCPAEADDTSKKGKMVSGRSPNMTR